MLKFSSVALSRVAKNEETKTKQKSAPDFTFFLRAQLSRARFIPLSPAYHCIFNSHILFTESRSRAKIFRRIGRIVKLFVCMKISRKAR